MDGVGGGAEKKMRDVWTEEDDVAIRICRQFLVLEILLPEHDDIIRQPIIVPYRIDIFLRQACIVIREVRIVWPELDLSISDCASKR